LNKIEIFKSRPLAGIAGSAQRVKQSNEDHSSE